MAYEVLNTCLFVPGLSKSECASWVQAWGSIGAIVLAGFLAWWQWRRVVQHEKAKELALAQVIGSEVLSIVHEQISILKKLDAEFSKAFQDKSIANINPEFIRWAVEIIPEYDIELLKDLVALGPNCARALATARGSLRQIQTIALGEKAQKFNFASQLTFLAPSVKTALQCLSIGQQELHSFLLIKPELSPMFDFGSKENSRSAPDKAASSAEQSA